MGRAIWLLGVVGCYAPTPVEDLPCSETDRCPKGQSCDSVFDVCASVPLCRTPAISDAFVSQDPCLPWGHVRGNGSVTNDTSGLHIGAIPDQSVACESDSDMPFDGDGLWIEVSMIPGVGGALELFADTGDSYSPGLIAHDGILELGLYASEPAIATLPYDASTMRWWRMRPVATGTIAEYSADGLDWHVLGISDVPPATTILPSITASTGAVDAGGATIVGFDICPATTREPAS